MPPDWTDHDRHMTEGRHLGVFSVASDAVLGRIGADAARSRPCSPFTRPRRC